MTTRTQPAADTAPGAAGPALVVIPALLFYLLTLAPGLLWGDSAKFQWMAWAGWLRFDEAGHPLWVLLLNPFCHVPGVSPALACNLSSALLAAMALWPAYRIMRRLGASAEASWIACLALAVSHTYWFHAVITEVYALNSLVTLVLLDTVMAFSEPGPGPPAPAIAWGALGLIWGLASGNHALVALWLPGYAWFIGRGWRAGVVRLPGCVAAAAGAALGWMPIFAVRMTRAKGATVAQVAERLWHGAWHHETIGRDLLAAGGYMLYQFPVPLLLAGAVLGLWRVRRGERAGLLLLYGVNAVFAFDFQVKDRFAFFLPSYLIVALLAGPGLDPVLAGLRRLAPGGAAVALVFILCVAAPPLFYHAAPALAEAGLLPAVGAVRRLPGRDSARYYLDPDKRGDEGARRFAEGALQAMDRDAVLLADAMLAEPLNYLQIVEGRRPDVLVTWMVPGRQTTAARSWARSGRPVYVGALDAYYDVAGLSAVFDIEPAGPVYRLERVALAGTLPPSGFSRPSRFSAQSR